MPRKSTPKNDVPPSQDDQILRMKAELKKMHSKIAEEKKKRRRLRRKLKEAVEKMEEVLSSAAVETLLNKARVEMAKGGYEATRTELREKQVKLKLATDREVQEDIVKKDQETIRRLEQRNMELTEALENGLDRKSWKECELCSQEFKEEGDRVPKLLKCGDTLCLGCVKHLANPDFLICPFDELGPSMPRKTTPKDDIPPNIRKKDAQIEKMKAELKKVYAELGAEKKRRRRIVRKNKEEVNRMRHDQWRIEDTIHRNNLSYEAEIKRKKEEFVKTRTELITLKLETDEKLQDEVLKKDQVTRELMEQRNRDLTEAVENGSDRKAWKECERCSLEFKEDGDRVPKFLKCGDTLCWGCIKDLAHPDFIMCPFDGTIFVFSENDNINHLRKNFKALSEL